MRIAIVTPTVADAWCGNRATSRRWADIFRQQGHHVRVTDGPISARAELLVALHARKSAASIAEFAGRRGRGPLVVALTGTDLWPEQPGAGLPRGSLELADRLVALQAEALPQLPRAARAKTTVIYQSARSTPRPPASLVRKWEVAVVAHLRDVKDPLRAAAAARRLPAESRIQISHLGKALTASWRTRAEAERERNARYRWLGGRSHSFARRRLARARLLVVSSCSEGGANVIAEAVVDQVPILATDVPGNRGLLGGTYPGYFDVGDTAGLADRLRAAESDPEFYHRLQQGIRAVADRFRPQREAASWQELLAALQARVSIA